jgi:hypothetical protein
VESGMRESGMTPDCSTAPPRPHGAMAKEKVRTIRKTRRIEHLLRATKTVILYPVAI